MDLTIYIAAGVGIVALIVYLVIRYERKRREAMKTTAQMLGFQYEQKAGMDAAGEAEAFHLFHVGHSKKIRNLMTRDDGTVRNRIYDYQYTTGGGQNSHTAIQTVFHFESQRLNLPAFILRPENVFHKIGKTFGYKDINFDAYPDFSNKILHTPINSVGFYDSCTFALSLSFNSFKRSIISLRASVAPGLFFKRASVFACLCPASGVFLISFSKLK